MQAIDFSKFGVPTMDPERAAIRLVQSRIDSYNALIGKDDGTDVHCEECHDKGDIAFVDAESGNFTIRHCKCYGTRLTVQRLQRCGIWERAKRCKLETFQTETPTQQAMKNAAVQFIAEPKGHWLMLCGQSGAGKTHLCTATFVQLSHRLGLAGQYLLWNADGRQLKAASMDDDTEIWDKYKRTELLYIDDLFKGRQDQGPSDADIRLAFELLDYRYNNQLITILSSEMTFDRLLALDQAIAGRVKEMCGEFLVSITPDVAKNFRLRETSEGGAS